MQAASAKNVEAAVAKPPGQAIGPIQACDMVPATEAQLRGLHAYFLRHGAHTMMLGCICITAAHASDKLESISPCMWQSTPKFKDNA